MMQTDQPVPGTPGAGLPPPPDDLLPATGSQASPRQSHRLLIGLIVATVLGVLFGGFLPAWAMEVEFLGKIFVNLLKVMVVPLVITSMVVGITGIGDIRHLGSYGGKVLLYFFLTTFLAVFLGIVLVDFIQPGKGFSHYDAGVFAAAGLKPAASGPDHWAADDPQNAAIAAALSHPVPPDAPAAPVASPTAPKPLPLTEDRALLRLTDTWPADDPRFTDLNLRLNAYAPGDPAARKTGRAGLEERLWADKSSVDTFNMVAAKASPADAAQAKSELAAHRLTPQEATAWLFQKRAASEKNANPLVAVKSIFESMVPTNIVRAASTDGAEILSLIVFGIFFGIIAVMLGARAKPVLDVITSLNDIIMAMVHVVILTAPVGIFALVAGNIGAKGGFAGFMPLLIQLSWYALTVVIGLLIHGFIFLPMLLAIFSNHKPLAFIGQMSRALVLAFTTASSSATLPVSIECAKVNAGISKRSREFILPLGATINMNGTALYEAVAVLFIAQIYGIEMTFTHQVLVFLTATLAAIGAAGIPEAGLVTMVMVMATIGVPFEGMSFILVIDWILDRCRTVINVWGDMVGCAIMDKLDPPKAEGS